MIMRNGLTAAILGMSLVAAMPALAQSQPDPVGVGDLEVATTALVDRFDTALRGCGLSPPYKPGVAVASNAMLVSYNPTTRLVQQSRWEEMPAEIQGLVTAWAGVGTLGLSPPDQFAEIFNSLLVPHELGHYVAVLDGRLERDDHWTNEVLANRIAIAFWALEPAGSTPIADRVANFTGFLNALPNPVPAGEDPHAYFEANYAALGRNPAAYGWYQGAFMTAAWEMRSGDTFCDLVNPEG